MQCLSLKAKLFTNGLSHMPGKHGSSLKQRVLQLSAPRPFPPQTPPFSTTANSSSQAAPRGSDASVTAVSMEVTRGAGSIQEANVQGRERTSSLGKLGGGSWERERRLGRKKHRRKYNSQANSQPLPESLSPLAWFMILSLPPFIEAVGRHFAPRLHSRCQAPWPGHQPKGCWGLFPSGPSINGKALQGHLLLPSSRSHPRPQFHPRQSSEAK